MNNAKFGILIKDSKIRIVRRYLTFFLLQSNSNFVPKDLLIFIDET